MSDHQAHFEQVKYLAAKAKLYEDYRKGVINSDGLALRAALAGLSEDDVKEISSQVQVPERKRKE